MRAKLVPEFDSQGFLTEKMRKSRFFFESSVKTDFSWNVLNCFFRILYPSSVQVHSWPSIQELIQSDLHIRMLWEGLSRPRLSQYSMDWSLQVLSVPVKPLSVKQCSSFDRSAGFFLSIISPKMSSIRSRVTVFQ